MIADSGKAIHGTDDTKVIQAVVTRSGRSPVDSGSGMVVPSDRHDRSHGIRPASY